MKNNKKKRKRKRKQKNKKVKKKCNGNRCLSFFLFYVCLGCCVCAISFLCFPFDRTYNVPLPFMNAAVFCIIKYYIYINYIYII